MNQKFNTIAMEYPWKYNLPSYGPFNWMVNDLWRGIQAEQNYLVALGLLAYSETIGWIIRGKLDADRNGWECYKLFTQNYIGYPHIDDFSIFDDIRNGLAHRYFVKNRIGAVLNDDGHRPCGIEISDNGINIYIYTYFLYFVQGVEKYLDEIHK